MSFWILHNALRNLQELGYIWWRTDLSIKSAREYSGVGGVMTSLWIQGVVKYEGLYPGGEAEKA